MSLLYINDDYERLTQQLQRLLEEKEELARRLQDANNKLQRLASTDPLIGVANRRRFTEALSECLAQAHRGEPMSLLMVDVDHFKNVNDEFGPFDVPIQLGDGPGEPNISDSSADVTTP